MRTNKPLSKIAATEYFEAMSINSKILEALGHRDTRFTLVESSHCSSDWGQDVN
jgi:hypothetical protein